MFGLCPGGVNNEIPLNAYSISNLAKTGNSVSWSVYLGRVPPKSNGGVQRFACYGWKPWWTSIKAKASLTVRLTGRTDTKVG